MLYNSVVFESRMPRYDENVLVRTGNPTVEWLFFKQSFPGRGKMTEWAKTPEAGLNVGQRDREYGA